MIYRIKYLFLYLTTVKVGPHLARARTGRPVRDPRPQPGTLGDREPRSLRTRCCLRRGSFTRAHRSPAAQPRLPVQCRHLHRPYARAVPAPVSSAPPLRRATGRRAARAYPLRLTQDAAPGSSPRRPSRPPRTPLAPTPPPGAEPPPQPGCRTLFQACPSCHGTCPRGATPTNNAGR